MPDLKLDRLSYSDAALYVLAVILHPQDLEKQARLFARLQNSQTSIAWGKGLPLATWRIDQALHQFTGPDKRDSDRTKGANVAAFMFQWALAGKSLNSAREKVQELHKIKIGESTFWRYWDQFQPAAHLNAARIFSPELPDLRSWLRIAEDLRRRGEAYPLPQSVSGRLLDTTKTWKVPEAVF